MGDTLTRRDLLKSGITLGVLLSGCRGTERHAFRATGLQQLRDSLQRSVDAGLVPGLVALVARGSEVETVTLGKTAFDGLDMRRDSIFRIASMTKPLTATAVMMLIEEGRVRLDEPVDRLLPELVNRKVLRRIDGALDDTVPAKRSITVEDLLTFRCGLGIVLAPPSRYPIQRAIADLAIVGFGPPDPGMPFDGDEWIRRVGTLPLLAQPGEDWLYTTGSDLQGVLVARASGQPLSRFLEERVFAPLGMKATAFFAPPEKADRLVTAYRGKPGGLVVADDPKAGQWSRPPAFEQGDAGLVSTADDYWAFARCLLANGQHDGRRLLAPESVRAMTTNHLTPAQRAGGQTILGRGRGWGYGMSVVTEDMPGQPKAGCYGWNGGFGTSWVSDPAAGLTMILLTQHEFSDAGGDPIHREFQTDAYRAQA